MANIYEMLAEWGCDVEAARERFMKDDDLYIKCLKIFAQDENFQNLGRYIQSGMYKQAFECAHTLKGVAGNLGITPLYRTTSELVEDLRKSKTDRLLALHETVIREYDELLHITTACMV